MAGRPSSKLWYMLEKSGNSGSKKAFDYPIVSVVLQWSQPIQRISQWGSSVTPWLTRPKPYADTTENMTRGNYLLGIQVHY